MDGCLGQLCEEWRGLNALMRAARTQRVLVVVSEITQQSMLQTSMLKLLWVEQPARQVLFDCCMAPVFSSLFAAVAARVEPAGSV